MNEFEKEDIAAIIAENIEKLRIYEGLSQIDMALRIKTNQAGYSLTESANRELNLLNLYYTAVEFNVNLNSLFGLSDTKRDFSIRSYHSDNLKLKDKRRKIYSVDKKIAKRVQRKNKNASNSL